VDQVIRVEVLAGSSLIDERNGSSVEHTLGSAGDLQHMLREFGLNYEQADYFMTRRVCIVIDPYTDGDPKDDEIERLRQALIASGVKEGLVDAIQKGGLPE
jgi:hypothetical protein